MRRTACTGLALGSLGFAAVAAPAPPTASAETAPAPASSSAAAHPEVVAALELFEIWVAEQMAYRHQPGLSIGIVHDQELVWARGFGFADLDSGTAAAADTIYRVGSITKTFTATALMLLVEEGRLRLDDPVRRHLPWLDYRVAGAEESAGAEASGGAEITIWHLLTHTSGLPRESAFPYWTDRRFPTREEMRRALAGQEALFEPGTDYQYSNLAIALAGEVVAAVSGESWAGFVERRIFAPLGMTRSFAKPPPPDRPGLATGYLVSRLDGTRPIGPATAARGLAPAADVSSTVEDLARFVSAQLGGSPAAGTALLGAGSLREMHRVHWLSPSWSSGRGLGFSVWRRDGRTLVGHGGWVAGHRASLAFEPRSKLGVVVLTNSDEGGPGAYVQEAIDLVFPALERATAPPPPPEPPAVADPGRYAGAYQNPWGEVSRVLVRGGGLAIYDHSYPPGDDPEGSLTRLVPAEGEHAFRTEAPRGRRGTPIVFELLEDGSVGRVKRGENYLYPVGCGTIGPDLWCRPE